jgi:hypothetical protein
MCRRPAEAHRHPRRRNHHHRRSVLLSWFHGRVVVSAVDGTRGRIMVVEMAVPISTLELQSREAGAMTSAAAATPTQLRRRDCTQPAPRFYHHHRHGIRPPNRRSRARAAPLPLSNVDHLLTDGAQKHQRWLTATSGASEQREQRLASTWATLARKPHQNRASRPVAGPMGSLQRRTVS